MSITKKARMVRNDVKIAQLVLHVDIAIGEMRKEDARDVLIGVISDLQIRLEQIVEEMNDDAAAGGSEGRET